MNEFILFTIAQTEGGSPSVTGGGLVTLMPLILIFAVFYFIVLRPQQKRQREHRQMLTQLKKGDEVVTTGGVIGKIASLTDDRLTLEVAERVKIRVLRSAISGLIRTESTAGGAAGKGK